MVRRCPSAARKKNVDCCPYHKRRVPAQLRATYAETQRARSCHSLLRPRRGTVVVRNRFVYLGCCASTRFEVSWTRCLYDASKLGSYTETATMVANGTARNPRQGGNACSMLRRAVRWCSREQPDGGGCLDIPTTENNKPTPTGTGELGVPALGLGQGRASAAATIIASGFGQGCVAILALSSQTEASGVQVQHACGQP